MRIVGSGSIISAILMVAVLCQDVWADDMVEGQKLYQSGKVKEAAAYFARAIDTNSYNASAHYFLGNCYAAQKNYAKAREEYRQAMEETEDKKMESYCRTALARLQAYPDAAATATSSASVVDRNAPSVVGGVSGSEIKVEKVQAIMTRGQQDAKTIIDRAEERCRPIMDEERAALAPMNYRLKGRIETTTADERDDVKKEFENRMTAIRNDAKEQARIIMDRARSEATSVGRGLPNLDDLLKN